MASAFRARRAHLWPTTTDARLPRLVAFAVGVGLLGLAVQTTLAAGTTAARNELDHTLTSQSSATAGELTEYLKQARVVALLLADNAALEQLEPGLATTAPRPWILDQAGVALAHLQQVYPGRVDEACLIDSTGTELVRVVNGVVAPPGDLSSEEASNRFFSATMRLPRGRVHQSAPYVSPDTGRRVISNSTPMVSASGRAWGLAHFEVGLDGFAPTVVPDAQGRVNRAWILDRASGEVVLDSGGPVAGEPPSAALVALARGVRGAASATVDGRRVAVSQVPSRPDQVSSWVVVVRSPSPVVPWWQPLGPAPLALGLAAVLLLGLVGANLRQSRRRLLAASTTDELTGLPNRRLLADRLDRLMLPTMGVGSPCGVLLIDLDRFKEVNDTLGHDHGDQLLLAVAGRLGASFPGAVSRLGGDEFAVLLPDVVDEAAALVLARRCLAELRENFVVEGIALCVEASAGLALGPQHGQDATALLRAADVAMYEAKASHTELAVYDPELDVNTPGRLALLGDLRRALDEDQLFLHFQPKVDLGTDEVCGVEALVRWQHPERGFVPPGDFVAAAEETGLILPLTLRTLELAIGQARRWLDDGHAVQVAVNLSPRCLLVPDFPATVLSMCERYRLPLRLLRLEITENAVMTDPARALTVLALLQESGVALSIDDFGTGYSSMTYLKRLPVDELKIDRSFVLGLLTDIGDGVLVRSSIDLAHNLGLTVVAEGVEDQATVEALRAMGCDVVQGYHLGRPMASADATEWMRTRRATAASTPAFELAVVVSDP